MGWKMNDEYWIYILNDEWLWRRPDRLLRPLNTLDGRNEIELELRVCEEWNEKRMMNIEYILNDDWLLDSP